MSVEDDMKAYGTLWYYSPSAQKCFSLQGVDGYPDAHGAYGFRSRKWEYKVGSRVILGTWRSAREVQITVRNENDVRLDEFMEACDADAANQVPGEVHAIGYGLQPFTNVHVPQEWVHTAMVVGDEESTHHMNPTASAIQLTFLLVDGGWRWTFDTAQFRNTPTRHRRRLEGLDMGVDLASPEAKNQKPFPKVYPTSITLSGLPALVDMHSTSSVQMVADVLPDDVEDDGVNWTVTGPAIIDSNGKLTFTGEGTVTVTAASTMKPSVTATASGTVYDSSKTVLPTGIAVTGLPVAVTLARTTSGGAVPKTFNLGLTFTPGNVTNKKVTWSLTAKDGRTVVGASAAASYATITQDGVLTVSKACNVTVTATSVIAPTVKGSASSTIALGAEAPSSITVSGAPDSVDASSADSFEASAVVSPSDADQTVDWTVDGPARILRG